MNQRASGGTTTHFFLPSFLFLLLCCFVIFFSSHAVSFGSAQQTSCGIYEANWTSLDTRPNPSWYDEAKFGIFIHWGVYSVPSWAIPGACCPNVSQNPYAEWYWNQQMNDTTATYEFHRKTYGPDFDYEDFAPQFTATLFNSSEWASIFESSGARYVVFTSKHHEGYTLWPSPQSWNWNSVDVGPGFDVVNVLSEAIRNVGLKFGIYYSLYEWFNPIYLASPKDYISEIMIPQMTDLITTYKPDIFWGDGCDDFDSYFWTTPEFMSWLFSDSSPVCSEVVINDRWGNDTQWKHGGFFTSEEEWPNPTKFGTHKWEDNRGMAWSYGYNRMEDISWFFPPEWYINLLITIVARGGNFLLDVGPTHDGIIPPNMEYILLEMGSWLSVNGEGIYSSSEWRVTNESEVTWYTWNSANSTLYAFITDWPSNSVLELLSPIPVSGASPVIEFIGLSNYTLPYTYSSETGFAINLPLLPPNAYPCKYYYTLRITNVN